jgi:two-component system NarL family sensor kinase
VGVLTSVRTAVPDWLDAAESRSVNRRLVGVGRACTVFAAAMAVVAVGVAMRQRDDILILAVAVLAVALLSVPVVGAAAVRATPRNPVGWILLAAGTSLPLAIAAFAYARSSFTDGSGLPAARWAGWLDGWPWIPAMLAVPTLGILLFPDGRLPSRRWRPLLWLDAGLIAALAFSTLFQPHLLDFPQIANPTGLKGPVGAVAEGAAAAIVLVAPASLLGALAFENRRRHSPDARERRILRQVAPAVWLITASWWGCVVIGASGGDTVDALPAEAVGMAALGVSAWVAVRRFGLFDARLVVRRGLVYGALTACVAAVYAVVAAVLATLGASRAAPPLALGAGVLVALPLRDRLQRAANRLVYGLRDDPYATLVRLSGQLETAAAASDVLPAAARSVREALRLRYVAIVVDGETTAAAGRSDRGRQDEVPLVFAGETIGAFVVESAESDRPLGADQRVLLAGIARQVAAAAHTVTLSRDLVSSRERLVAATAEERRRLRRDLHDGLGPTLSSVVLGLRRAHALLDTRPTAAAAQLDVLTAQIQDAVAEVRRLVYGLRPPALDELGLLGALDEQAQTLGPITVQGPAQPLALSAAVEVAAYRIAVEAMTNAARHSRASQVTVHLEVDDSLHLEIADDGIGLPVEYRAGVGITSMRERASELGGLCTVERRSPSGTLVRATVPLEPV